MQPNFAELALAAFIAEGGDAEHFETEPFEPHPYPLELYNEKLNPHPRAIGENADA